MMAYLCNRVCENKKSFGNTEYGYCKTTYCINPLFSNIGTAQYGQGVQKSIITNADRIRNLTDEELANELAFVAQDAFCYGRGLRDKMLLHPFESYEEILKWLKQEANS